MIAYTATGLQLSDSRSSNHGGTIGTGGHPRFPRQEVFCTSFLHPSLKIHLNLPFPKGEILYALLCINVV